MTSLKKESTCEIQVIQDRKLQYQARKKQGIIEAIKRGKESFIQENIYCITTRTQIFYKLYI